MRFVFSFSFAVLLASAAVAATPDARSGGAIAAAVQREFLAPYAAWQAERSEFSRAAMPPSELRARVIGEPQNDTGGAEFVPFAVEARYSDGEWEPAEMTGCVYVASSAVYVKRGDRFLAAGDYFAQKPATPAASVCAP